MGNISTEARLPLKKLQFFILLVSLFALPAQASGAEEAEGKSWWGSFSDSVSLAWDKGTLDLYVPVVAWHNRFMYERGEANQFNEIPWGFGIGRSAFDDDGDQHGLVAMGFIDSNDHFQPLAGYTYISNWQLVGDLSAGLGVVAGLSARHELYYIPFPAALPVASIQYKNFAIQATYIPGPYNHSNVLFTWVRWHFD